MWLQALHFRRKTFIAQPFLLCLDSNLTLFTTIIKRNKKAIKSCLMGFASFIEGSETPKVVGKDDKAGNEVD